MSRLWIAMWLGAWIGAGIGGTWLAGWGYGQTAPPEPPDLTIPSEKLQLARLLVQKLGSESYREREEAFEALAKMGRQARPALLEALTGDPNPEVRYRAARLLPQANAEEFQARLTAFYADSEGKHTHVLPGLALFRKHIGTDTKARNLYAEFLKSPHNLELLEALDRGASEAGRAIADRRSSLFAQMQGQKILPGGVVVSQPQPLQFADIACLLFAESVTPARMIPANSMFAFMSSVMFLQQPASLQMLRANTPHAEVYRRIVGLWLDTREDPNELNNLVHLVHAAEFQSFPQTLTILRRVATSDSVQGFAKAQAVMVLVRRFGKQEVPLLKKLLTDDTMVTQVWFGNPAAPNQPPVMFDCRVRDIALAYLLDLTGQRARMPEYGFRFPPGAPPGAIDPNNYGSYAFESDEARTYAAVKFGFWQLKYGRAEKAEPATSTNSPPRPPGSAPPPPPLPPGPPPVPPRPRR